MADAARVGSGQMQDGMKAAGAHDPGDAVPEGVAVQQPAPLSKEDEAVKRRLEQMGRRQAGNGPDSGASD